MNGQKLIEKYFKWIFELVFPEDSPYKKLCSQLFDIDFRVKLPMDANRAEDGMDLRYRFGYEKRIDYRIIAKVLDAKPCSVLEMMAALALRCEEDFMSDPQLGDQTARWFGDMLISLGLYEMTDDNYNAAFVERKVNNFLDRIYSRNGRGGLFTIKDRSYNMRTAEIWYQACRYMNEIIDKMEE